MHLSKNRGTCLGALFLCGVLWLFAPFVAINIITLDEQPSALQIIMDDVTYFGDRTGSPLFWITVISAAGILSSLFCLLIDKATALRIIAAITDILLLRAVVTTWLVDSWRKTEEIGEVIECLRRACGIGFWGIFTLLLFVALFARKETVVK